MVTMNILTLLSLNGNYENHYQKNGKYENHAHCFGDVSGSLPSSIVITFIQYLF